ncbi:hypothetical protein ABI_30270 [Asticcacaulis biprosthecium C19]|uniref:Uncharacterized protein n=1 Tax=Asticcacaulis biprosthecium C19 TaxID=715226 RepID=F4QN19_9CAUL|nr:hypothetical protein ABI_30270 [Asticcacaulis biprosthecium C19]
MPGAGWAISDMIRSIPSTLPMPSPALPPAENPTAWQQKQQDQ